MSNGFGDFWTFFCKVSEYFLYLVYFSLLYLLGINVFVYFLRFFGYVSLLGLTFR